MCIYTTTTNSNNNNNNNKFKGKEEGKPGASGVLCPADEGVCVSRYFLSASVSLKYCKNV